MGRAKDNAYQKSGPAYSYYVDSPLGCLRVVARVGEEIIGIRFGREYRVQAKDCTPLSKRDGANA